MERRRVMQMSLAISLLLVVGAVAFLPWRTVFAIPGVRIAGQFVNPTRFGSHLYQMNLPFYLAGLFMLTAVAVGMGLLLGRGRWPSRLIFLSGVGIVMLTLLVQQAPATTAFIGVSRIQPGNTVALLAGFLVTLTGACAIFRNPFVPPD
jgi:hypothetical protein